MHLGRRNHSYASLEVMPGVIDDEDKLRLIGYLKTAKAYRKQGHASRLMRDVCIEANQSQTVLLVQPKGSDHDAPLSDEQLELFYMRYGFKVIQREPIVLMAREPR